MKPLSKMLLVVYLLFLVWLVLFKLTLDFSILDIKTRSVNLVPFAGSSADHKPVDLREILYNCVVFFPLGLLLGVNFHRAGFWQKLLVVSGISLAAEIAQYVLAVGVTDISDLITNTAGGFLGLAFYSLCNKHINTQKLNRVIVLVGAILLVLFILLRVLLFSNIRYQ